MVCSEPLVGLRDDVHFVAFVADLRRARHFLDEDSALLPGRFRWRLRD